MTHGSFCERKGVAEMSPRLSDELKEKRNLQILDAAKQVFIKKGYGMATLKDIIEETGMSRGWIYLYYKSKDEIFEALLDYQDEQYDQYLSEKLDRSDSIWEVLLELYSQQLNVLQLTENGGLMAAFYEYLLMGWRDLSCQELIMHRYEKGIQRFTTILQIGVDRGEFSPVMELSDISRLAASYQEGIVTHSIAVGIETANTKMQFDSLLAYLKNLLQPNLM